MYKFGLFFPGFLYTTPRAAFAFRAPGLPTSPVSGLGPKAAQRPWAQPCVGPPRQVDKLYDEDQAMAPGILPKALRGDQTRVAMPGLVDKLRARCAWGRARGQTWPTA